MWEVRTLLEHRQYLPLFFKQDSCQSFLELGLFICLGWIQGNKLIPVREVFLGSLLLLNFLSGLKCPGLTNLSQLAAKWLPRDAQASECHLEMEMCEWIHCTPWLRMVGKGHQSAVSLAGRGVFISLSGDFWESPLLGKNCLSCFPSTEHLK